MLKKYHPYQDDEDESTRTAFAVLIPLVLLLVAFVVGFGVFKAQKRPDATAAIMPPTSQPVPANEQGMASEDEARVVVENGIVKFYFASGKAEVAATAAVTIIPELLKTAAGKTVVLSGYHDTTGDPVLNAALSKQRAEAVRDVLVAAGFPAASIDMKKPEDMTGSGVAAEARRVELIVK